MQYNISTQLNLLMKEFKVTGKKLSEYLHVDSSLISKWKTGKRKVNQNYIESLAELFVSLDAYNSYRRIEKLTKMHLINSSQKNIFDIFVMWLATSIPESKLDSLERYLPRNVNRQDYYTFHGKDGRRKAIEVFLSYLENKNNIKIRLYTQEDNIWFSESKNFLGIWFKKNKSILNNGNSIDVIHPMDRRYKQIAHSLLNWIPLHLEGDLHSYILDDFSDPDTKSTIFLAEDEIALIGVSSTNYSKKIRTYLYMDKEFLSNMSEILDDHFSHSLRLFNRFEHNISESFFQKMSLLTSNSKEIFFLTNAPILYMVNKETLLEILNQDDYSEKDKKMFHKIANKFSFSEIIKMPNLKITYIIPRQNLINILNLDQVLMRLTSKCLGKPMYITQELFRKLLLESIETLVKTNRFKIILTNKNMFHNLNNTAFFAKEHTIAGIIGAKPNKSVNLYDKALTTNVDIAVSSLFYSAKVFVNSHRKESFNNIKIYHEIFNIIKQIN